MGKRDMTGPKQEWSMWIDISTLEYRDREAGKPYRDFDLSDLAAIAQKVAHAVQTEDRAVVVRITLSHNEEER